jgi:multidrug efflux system membrane fusion protein
LVVVVFALLIVFTVIFAWRFARQSSAYAQGAHEMPPVQVTALTVQPETLPQSLDAFGSLEAIKQVTLSPEVSGRVVAIHFDAGDAAKHGETLVQLFDAPERADLDAAVAKAQFAKLQVERSEELAPTGAESRQVLQQRTAELEQAQAAVKQLQARIEQKTIRAPFDGRIGIRRISVGEYVNAGDDIATLAALDKLYVNFTVPQQALAKLAVGGKVMVHSDAFPDKVFVARINAIDPVVGADTRNVAVQATLANSEQLLRPGMYATVSIELAARPSAIVVPTTAIVTSASGDSALVVRDGKAQVVPLVTGQRVGTRVVVENGLAAGDVVIVNGQLRVQPGAAVAIAAAPAPVSAPGKE